jgi:transposase
MHCEKMAVTDMSLRQRALVEFLVKGVIYERLHAVYGDACMGASSIRRRVKHFKDGNTDIANQPHNGRPRTAATEHKKSTSSSEKTEG